MSQSIAKFGPVAVEPGTSRSNMWALMYVAFVTIGLVTAIATVTPYLLTTNLGIAEADQGKALGTLAFWQEITLILVFGPIGILADKYGRQIVYAAGFATLAVAYLLYPFATTLTELSITRVLYALGVGAMTGMLATVIADYGVEEDRGKLTAMCGFLNGLGVVLLALGVGKLPAFFAARGADDVVAGQQAMFVVAAMSLFSAAMAWTFLRRGVPQAVEKLPDLPFATKLKQGFGIARTNRRIALAYASGFVARGDIAIVGLFASAWGKKAALEAGMSPTEALAAGIIPFVVAQSAALLWAPVVAVPLDRIPRMAALGWCMVLGMIGYCCLFLVSDPLQSASFILFALLGIGQISALLGAQSTIGKEANEAMRGSIIGVFNFCGAVGILLLTVIGGWLFDHVGPWAPFFLVGVLNGIVGIAALLQDRRERAGA